MKNLLLDTFIIKFVISFKKKLIKKMNSQFISKKLKKKISIFILIINKRIDFHNILKIYNIQS